MIHGRAGRVLHESGADRLHGGASVLYGGDVVWYMVVWCVVVVMLVWYMTVLICVVDVSIE